RTRMSGRLQALLTRELERVEAKSNTARALKRALADLRERTRTREAYARRKEQWQAAVQADADEPAPSADDAAGPGTTPSISAHARSRLRVGVLPFLSHTSKREGNLAFSLSQEIAAALARFRWFDVIAPISLRATPATRFLDERHL